MEPYKRLDLKQILWGGGSVLHILRGRLDGISPGDCHSIAT